jgi:hypothetical protein
MKINLRRFLFESETSIGMLHVNDIFECFTLEDLPRTVKIKGETCIPLGVYRVIVQNSPKFGRLMPYLVDVPNFTGIMIHSGNDKEDTHGCILVGQKIASPERIENSKIAFDALFVKIQKAFESNEDIFISVEEYAPTILY